MSDFISFAALFLFVGFCGHVAAQHTKIAASAGPPPDLILYNGKIFTADPQLPKAEAIAIRGDRIVAVGASADITLLADVHTRLMDLKGRTVVPGLNDAHTHLGIRPTDEVFVETESDDPNWLELSAAIRKAAAQAPKGAILSGAFGTTIFYDPKVDRAALDKVAPDNPVILGSFDGHADILNSAALTRLGIGEDIADPMGGRFERGPDGKLTGVAREYAAWSAVGRHEAAITSDEEAVTELGRQLTHAAQYGITSLQDMPTDMSTERTGQLLAKLPATIRVRITRMNTTTPTGPDYKEGASAPTHPAPLLTVNGTKWVLDGVIFEASLTPRTAAAAEATVAGSPYSFAGLPPLFSPSGVDEMLRDSLRHNYQLQFHVFGRPAATELFEALQRTGGPSIWKTRRLRIEHGDGLSPDLIARGREFGVIVSQQGTHFGIAQIDPSLDAGFLDRLRADHAQPLRSLLNAGIPVALGSDGPLNPWLSILGAVTTSDRPEEAITREQAVTAYTYGSAYAEFEEKDKGRLAAGMLADLAVLSQDVFSVPFSELPKTKSVLTFVGGRIVYDAHEVTGR
jgi:predicted amidohydrolase YtcJ